MDRPELLPRTPLRLPSAIALLAILLLGAAFVCIMMVSRRPGSLTAARAAAKQVQCQAELMAIGKGLEMFANDFRDYPDSRLRRDPIVEYPGGKADRLSGAHWLARALGGHDGNGVDEKQTVMADGDIRKFSIKEAGSWERKGTYLDPRVFARDDRLHQGGDYQPTGRDVLVDTYLFPILYYRLSGGALPQSETDASGLVCHQDNSLITGASDIRGWDFAGTQRRGPVHCIGQFVTTASPASANSCESFVAFLRNRLPATPASQPGGKKQKGYLLIAAGPDGIYGTIDDIIQQGMSTVP
jgi:hypothetical protein